MARYQLISPTTAFDSERNCSFPVGDLGNGDSRDFQAWLLEGNEPDPAPAPPPAKNDVLLELLGTMSPTEPDLDLLWLVLTESLRP